MIHAERHHPGTEPPFNAEECLRRAGARWPTRYARDAVIFRQGEPADTVLYIQSGSVRVSFLSSAGKEAVVAILRQGDFLGEGCMAGQRCRANYATAIAPTSIMSIERHTMARLLRDHRELSSMFITHILARNTRVAADLADQLLNSSEKRLARTLLLLATDNGAGDAPNRSVPRLSQETLADMVGTTRSRVNFFMNKFRRLGFVDYDNADIRIQESLSSVLSE